MKSIIALIALLLTAIAGYGQTMVTADTLGKGKTAGFAAANALLAKDFATMSLTMAQGWYGLNNKVDVFAGASDTAVFGKHQVAGMFGGNINLLKSKAIGISTFHAFSVPINRRRDGNPTWFAAVVASKNFGKVTGYTGYSANIPLQNSTGKLFTSDNTVYNLPIGILIPKGKWGYFIEYDYGSQVKTFGVGISFAP